MKEVTVPDIGDFRDVPVIEIAVALGDIVAVDSPLLVLESDKATLDVPSPFTGRVAEILVRLGDRVSAGSPILRLEPVGEAAASAPVSATAAPAADPAGDEHDLVVIGGGPGGYTAAFRAADLGRRVTIIDPRATLGGVCLNVGCIPSKALLHLAKVCEEAVEASAHGLCFGPPDIDLGKVRGFKDSVVTKLTSGLASLAKRRKVCVLRGEAKFTGPNSLTLTGPDAQEIRFSQAIIAVGSRPETLPFLPEDPRIIDSTGALDLADVPGRMLVIGGGVIGLEMAQVYHAFGARIEVVELAAQIIPGADRDIVAPLAKHIAARYDRIRTGTRVTAVTAGGDALSVTFEGAEGTEIADFDSILVAVGRVPNGDKIAAEAAGITVEGPGFIPVDAQMRSKVPHIFAIGDVVGQPMLAHKAAHEGKVAAEAACGHKVAFEPACIPSVAYTDPEVAWVGLTELAANARGLKVGKGSFPWAASGRALSIGRPEGLSKLLFDPDTGKILGAAMVGAGAGELIAEMALAIEMGATAEDIALTIHPHPTLSETAGLAAEAWLGVLTDL